MISALWAAFIGSKLFERVFPVLCIAVIVTSTLVLTYSVGKEAGKRIGEAKLAAYRAEVAEQEAAMERARDLDRIRRAERSEKIIEEHIVVQTKIRTVYRNILKEVPVYVPVDSCPLPAGWRLLHDAAAEGRDPEPPGSPDAAPVPAQDAAATVIENYEACRADQQRLTDLQRWVREVAPAEVTP